ncbi:MAG: Smr/MutS family protein [Bryobacteraceae bacterium]
MSSFSSGILEFDAVLALLGRYISSPAGEAALARISPSTERAALEEALADAAEAIEYTGESAKPQGPSRGTAVRLRFENLPDPEPLLAKLAIVGVVLDGGEIRSTLALLDRACDARAGLTQTAVRFPRLAARAGRIADFRPLVNDLGLKIEPSGRVADNASVALSRVRRDMERQQRQIQESLERFLRAHRDDGILQDEFVAIRNERFVLPVVAGQKRRVDGIIHAASGTGHTLFVEPMETVELNNDLVRLREREHREAYRILEELTGRLRAAAHEIREAAAVLADLEVLFAKARFAAEFECVIPHFSPPGEPRIELRDARHPLLADVLRRQAKKVVPLTLELGGGQRTLLISGPNTGGKTVALKTVGLCCLMAQSGLPVPASEARLPLFEQVLADIGDHQSLEASLSSFSAHMARVKEIAETVGPEALVLLDEVGRATDPEEGGALAVAVLDWMRRAGAFTLASTHLVAPKIYGATTEGVLNGAMSFDEATLMPTYSLRTGTPGASAGLAIAQRLGMPAILMERARGAMSEQQRDLERLLRLLEARIEAAAAAERDWKARRAELDREQEQAAEALAKREAARAAELAKRTEALLQSFDERAREAIERIADTSPQKKAAWHAARHVAQTKREIREEVDRAAKPAAQETVETPALELREGVRVRLRGVREPGRVRRLLGGGVVEVEAGFLKLQAPAADVVEVLPESAAPASRALGRGISVRTAPRESGLSQELNLIGKRAEEAVAEVDRFLDSAALASMMRVRIIHGHGMGVLKKAVADLLAGHPLVEKFYPAGQEEGGSGATIVELAE